ncbi:MAG: hypothetical protein RIT81_06680, partial [Deltaproteobacteria bacterium]
MIPTADDLAAAQTPISWGGPVVFAVVLHLALIASPFEMSRPERERPLRTQIVKVAFAPVETREPPEETPRPPPEPPPPRVVRPKPKPKPNRERPEPEKADNPAPPPPHEAPPPPA